MGETAPSAALSNEQPSAQLPPSGSAWGSNRFVKTNNQSRCEGSASDAEFTDELLASRGAIGEHRAAGRPGLIRH